MRDTRTSLCPVAAALVPQESFPSRVLFFLELQEVK